MSLVHKQPDPGDRIAAAALALAEGRVQRPVVPALRQRGLTAKEIAEACRLAEVLRRQEARQ